MSSLPPPGTPTGALAIAVVVVIILAILDLLLVVLNTAILWYTIAQCRLALRPPPNPPAIHLQPLPPDERTLTRDWVDPTSNGSLPYAAQGQADSPTTARSHIQFLERQIHR
jgi:hypothetical protein